MFIVKKARLIIYEWSHVTSEFHSYFRFQLRHDLPKILNTSIDRNRWYVTPIQN